MARMMKIFDEEEDFIEPSPVAKQHANKSVFEKTGENKVKNNTKLCSENLVSRGLKTKPCMKRKIVGSPDMTRGKQKQLTISNFVTRLRKQNKVVGQEHQLFDKNNCTSKISTCLSEVNGHNVVSNNAALDDSASVKCSTVLTIPMQTIDSGNDINCSSQELCDSQECENLCTQSTQASLYDLINIRIDPGWNTSDDVSKPNSVPLKHAECSTSHDSGVTKLDRITSSALDPASSVAKETAESNYECEQSFSSMSDLDWEKDATEVLTCSFSSNVSDNQEASNTECSTFSKEITYEVTAINKRQKEMELSLMHSSESSSYGKICILKGFWMHTLINVGDSVRVLAPFVKNCAVVDDASGFLIVHPDFLISSTAVCSTLFCMRKSVLSEKFQFWDFPNKVMLIGKLVHQLFQQVISDQCASQQEIEDILEKIMKRSSNIFEMYCQDVTKPEVKSELLSFVSSISSWMNQYCAFDRKFSLSKNVQITGVQDIEDNVWCPQYGLKGKIDLTVEVNMQKEKSEKLMPLELKTGAARFSAEHEGQVHLYSLMMEDRTELNHQSINGLLLYLRGQHEMKYITADHAARRGLIQLRNDLAHYTYRLKSGISSQASESSQNHFSHYYLPDPINHKTFCEKCAYFLPCTLYQKAFDGNKPSSPTHAMSMLVPKSTEHLTEQHLEFYRHWSRLLHLECSSSESNIFWNEDAETREAKGLCFSNMVLREDILTQQVREGAAHIHTFFRSSESSIKSSFLSIGFKHGDYIAISNQKNKLEVALATGYIVCIEDHFVQVSVERDIQRLSRYESYLFRLDKQIPNSSLSTNFTNLMKLMIDDERSKRLRELIIEKWKPEFHSTMSKNIAFLARPFLKCLNKSQRKAVFKALMAKDYLLLKGMPGTGKTSTIVALIRLLIKLENTVLLTSHTHSAVDNILLKLSQHNTEFVRLGQLPKIHTAIHPFTFEVLTKDMVDVSELDAFMKSKLVVATTCLGLNNGLFRKLKFDVCIVDECSQIALTTCLGPLYLAKKFILVGDPKQLPPIVNHRQTEFEAMQESLFSHLENSENHMGLAIQYRMNREIMHLCNSLTYEGVMKCGSEEVETATLNTTEVACLHTSSSLQHQWLSIALDNQLQNSALFLNTDDVPARESRDAHSRIHNYIENQLVFLLVKHLLKGGISPDDVGVITPYRCQVELLSNTLLRENNISIEVNTVDQYQGRDKEVIIISCVRSNCDTINENQASRIVGDERRLNVALSRAKKKLLIIGSKSTLLHYDCFKSLFEILRPGQIITLPKNAHVNICD